MKTLILENERARLLPLTMDNYTLISHIASEDKLIQYSPSDISTNEAFKTYVINALTLQEENNAIPFIIYDKQKEAYAGSTRFMNIGWDNGVLEIGSTWLGRGFQGSGLNKNIKFLMLQHAFETLGFEKVEFRIDERNFQSRKAVEKIGATLEGILRKNVIMLDGFRRNTCCYGILKSEWADIKTRVFKKLE